MIRLASASILAVLLVAAAAAPAHADRRAFGYVYEYQTMPQGGLDLELWNTQSRPDLSTAASAFQFQLEVEYGITDHWDIALYQVFEQGLETGASFSYAETKVETRYRFAERGELPVDILAYFEFVKPLSDDIVELEWKAILARDFGPITIAANLIAELELGGPEAVFIPGWALGVSYEPMPAWKLSVETFGELHEAEEGEERKISAWVGPSISWAPSPKLWITGTAAFGLTSTSDDFLARLIIGISI